MNIIFLTLIDISDIKDRGIYHDLLRKFRHEGHEVFVISASERRKKEKTNLKIQEGIHILKVKTLNVQKTNWLEKGVATLLLEYQYLAAFKKFFGNISFDLVLYSTPPITLTKVIVYIKRKNKAVSYLLLKDIFPQNAVDLGILKNGGILHRFFEKKENHLYSVSDYIGCMSPANVVYIKKHHPELSDAKVEVNPNSIKPIHIRYSTEEKEIIRESYGIPSSLFTFIYGGNLGKPQGISFLLEVLEANITNFKLFFVIVGSGTEYSLIEQWFNKFKPINCILIKSLPKNEFDKLLKACDVGLIFLDKRFTIPNFPSRLLSYLECSMPVLAATDKNTDIGRIIEKAGCGLWVQSGDINGMLHAINKLFGNEDDFTLMKKRGRALLENDYNVDISYQLIKSKIRLNV